MKSLASLKNRLAPVWIESEQAVIRLVISFIVLAFLCLWVGPRSGWGSDIVALALGVALYLIASVGIFAAICIWPHDVVHAMKRRYLGMLLDNATTTIFMLNASEVGVSLVGVYLFVAIGNGFRYGSRFLWTSAILSWMGFLLVMLSVPYWQQNRPLGLQLFAVLIVLPLYVNALLKRLWLVAIARAEKASQKTIEIERLQREAAELRTGLDPAVRPAGHRAD